MKFNQRLKIYADRDRCELEFRLYEYVGAIETPDGNMRFPARSFPSQETVQVFISAFVWQRRELDLMKTLSPAHRVIEMLRLFDFLQLKMRQGIDVANTVHSV